MTPDAAYGRVRAGPAHGTDTVRLQPAGGADGGGATVALQGNPRPNDLPSPPGLGVAFPVVRPGQDRESVEPRAAPRGGRGRRPKGGQPWRPGSMASARERWATRSS